MNRSGERPPTWLQARNAEPVLVPRSRAVETLLIGAALAGGVVAVYALWRAL